jgi:threonyl-tRNA synthetase
MLITLPDGAQRDFALGSTGLDIAKSISEGLARNAVGIVVNQIPYDLSRPINHDASIRILTMNL